MHVVPLASLANSAATPRTWDAVPGGLPAGPLIQAEAHQQRAPAFFFMHAAHFLNCGISLDRRLAREEVMQCQTMALTQGRSYVHREGKKTVPRTRRFHHPLPPPNPGGAPLCGPGTRPHGWWFSFAARAHGSRGRRSSTEGGGETKNCLPRGMTTAPGEGARPPV